MVIDQIKNSFLYYGLGLHFKNAFRYLNETDLNLLEQGTYNFEKEGFKLKIFDYYPKAPDSCNAEAHRKYADIHYIIRGKELIGYSNIDLCDIIIKYDKEKDISIYDGKFIYLPMKQGFFSIFFPDDIHKPGLSSEGNIPVKKAVVKILL